MGDIDASVPVTYIFVMPRPKSRPSAEQRFAVGAEVLVKTPGITGVVMQLDYEPTVLWGEYWHTVRTERGERREPGCNLELIPTPKTNTESRTHDPPEIKAAR